MKDFNDYFSALIICPYHRRLFEKLNKASRSELHTQIALLAPLTDPNERALKINRLYIDMREATPRNHTIILELLTAANHRAYIDFSKK